MVNLSEGDLARLASFPEQNPNPVIELSLDGKVTYCNPAAKKSFPDLPAKNISHELFRVLREKLDSPDRSEINNYKCEVRIGRAFYEQKFYYIEESRILRVYSADITEQKETEKKLANLALFPEHNPNPVVEADLISGNVTYSNLAARRYFPDIDLKNTGHELFGKIVTRLADKKDFSCETSVGNKIFEQKVFYIPGTDLIRVYSHDITGQKEIERNLARLASFPELNPSPIIELDLTGKITYINQAFRIHFADTSELGPGHPVMQPVREHFESLIRGEIKNYSRELYVNGIYYMQRGSILGDYGVIRVFCLDITQQKESEKIISERNKDITDSITYAKRIQAAIVPSEEFIQKHLEQSFVIYRPKDIVAGDFYWMEYLDDTIFIAAADCTGHGVPGAMVSVVCCNALNRAAKEFGLREPGKILDKTRELVIETFAKNNEELKDGMDISLLAIDRKNKTIAWSGANNSLWYFAGNVFEEIKPDKQPVGNYPDKKPFTTHIKTYNEGDMFYLFTDGFPDQFGGERAKKFTYKRLKESIAAVVNFPVRKQGEKLESDFLEWKGELEQIDDVTLIGIRV
jgi:serine phosphatase RsbU (regulator of sigma subunit)/PAS domain-containing protein